MVSNGLFLLGIIVLFLTSPSREEESGSPSEVEDDGRSLNTYIVHVEKSERRVSAQLDDLDSWYHHFCELPLQAWIRTQTWFIHTDK